MDTSLEKFEYNSDAAFGKIFRVVCLEASKIFIFILLPKKAACKIVNQHRMYRKYRFDLSDIKKIFISCSPFNKYLRLHCFCGILYILKLLIVTILSIGQFYYYLKCLFSSLDILQYFLRRNTVRALRYGLKISASINIKTYFHNTEIVFIFQRKKKNY